MIQGQQRGADYRLDLLKRAAEGGIPIHCKGGFAYDRHMRRLVDDGLLVLERTIIGFGPSKRSILRATQKDVSKVHEAGLLRDTALIETGRNVVFFYQGENRIVEMRRVLVGEQRVSVARIGRAKPGSYEVDDDGTFQRLFCQSFRAGSLVYRMRGRLSDPIATPDKHNNYAVRAGILRKTGRGLVLDRYISFYVKSAEPEQYERLSALLPHAIIQHFRPDMHFCIHVRTDEEAVIAQIIVLLINITIPYSLRTEITPG